jgi:DNA polymerase-3 subunit epsilon
VEKAVASLKDSLPTFAIMENGGRPGFKSCVLVEQGSFYGMGELPGDAIFNDSNDLKPFLQHLPENEYIRGLIFSHAEKNPDTVIEFS